MFQEGNWLKTMRPNAHFAGEFQIKRLGRFTAVIKTAQGEVVVARCEIESAISNGDVRFASQR